MEWMEGEVDGWAGRGWHLCVGSAGVASAHSGVTAGVLQAETGLVTLSHLPARGDVQEVVVTERLHAVVVPGDVYRTPVGLWRTFSPSKMKFDYFVTRKMGQVKILHTSHTEMDQCLDLCLHTHTQAHTPTHTYTYTHTHRPLGLTDDSYATPIRGGA